MINEQQQEQAVLHVLGLLPDAERAAFERLVVEDGDVRQLVGSLSDLVGVLARALPPVAPSPAVKARVLARISPRSSGGDAAVVAPVAGSSGAGARVLAFPSWAPWAAAAALAVAGTWLLFERRAGQGRERRLAARIEDLALEIQAAEADKGRLLAELSAARSDIARLEAAGDLSRLRLVVLGPLQADQPAAAAVSVWSQEGQQGVLVVSNLKPTPPGSTYQLWIVDPGAAAPVDAGVFAIGEDGRGRVAFRPSAVVSAVSQMAVTLERAGGVPSPEGPMVLAGGT